MRPFREQQGIEQVGHFRIGYLGLGIRVESDGVLLHLDAYIYGVERTRRNYFVC